MIEIKPPSTRLPPVDARPRLFIAGGITNCPDWQRELVEKLHSTSYTIYNPRRDEFDVVDPTVAVGQIKWEHERLAKADIISFWFPKATLCPITLFELGAHLTSVKAQIVIGIEDGYQREFDVVVQTDLVDKTIPIFHSLDDMAIFLRGYAHR